MILEIIIGLFISYSILFFLSIYLKDNSIVDIFWGLGFIQIIIHTIYFNQNLNLFKLLVLFLVLFWGLRLSKHIFVKKLLKKEEDPRYQEFRKTWKFFYIRSIFQVYLLQGFLMFIISTPLIYIFSTNNYQNSLFFIIGILISVFGFIIEIIADKEFLKFLKNKKQGDIMDKGLWKYTRHPNYFGESLIWLGISIISLPISIISIISYLTIFSLLRFVSGVPMAEKNLTKNPKYKEYMKKTPAFFPKLKIFH